MSLIGVSLDKSPIYIVTEFMAKVSVLLFDFYDNMMSIGFHGGLFEITRQSSHLKTKPT